MSFVNGKISTFGKIGKAKIDFHISFAFIRVFFQFYFCSGFFGIHFSPENTNSKTIN